METAWLEKSCSVYVACLRKQWRRMNCVHFIRRRCFLKQQHDDVLLFSFSAVAFLFGLLFVTQQRQ